MSLLPGVLLPPLPTVIDFLFLRLALFFIIAFSFLDVSNNDIIKKARKLHLFPIQHAWYSLD